MDCTLDRYHLQDMQYSLRSVEAQLQKYTEDAEIVRDLIAVCRDILEDRYDKDRLLEAVMKVETTYVANAQKS